MPQFPLELAKEALLFTALMLVIAVAIIGRRYRGEPGDSDPF